MLNKVELRKLLEKATIHAGGPLVLRTEAYPRSESDAPAWPYESVLVDENGDRVASFIDMPFAQLAGAAANSLPLLLDHIDRLEEALRAEKDLAANLSIGMEEIRDAVWDGDDAIERIRGCANRWLSGDEERLDAQMRSELSARTLLGDM